MARRGFLIALALSIALHLSVVGGPGWHVALLDDLLHPPPPLEARLLAPPKLPAPPLKPSVPPAPPRPAGQDPGHGVASWSAATAPPAPQAVPTEELLPAAPLAEVMAAVIGAVPQIAPPLPRRGRLRFALVKGEGGFVVGQAIHEWHHDGQVYTIRATTETTGLAALFRPAKVVQTSSGGFFQGELRPARFEMDRGDNDVVAADFDWSAMRVTLSSGQVVAFSEGAEDMLSMFYQLMQAAQRGEGFQMAVATGRKVERYAFEWLGQETLLLKAGRFTTWHVRVRSASGGGDTTEVWLGKEAAGLPVKIRHLDRKGELFDQLAEEMDYEK
ncbi:DUF3108 domain-containing protein [Denitratisoma sp. DHT3]|uniref:DUF3108 domain-containing protein n=2 Tax=Denitratisoma sp. DHT3 TaxID=1981880 RepID=UPI0016456F34|nr:DUF3108 domain-containing protein [Denitratisoma sp. DHT3]